MENSPLTVFQNVQPIIPRNNLSFDQTNKKFYFVLFNCSIFQFYCRMFFISTKSINFKMILKGLESFW